MGYKTKVCKRKIEVVDNGTIRFHIYESENNFFNLVNSTMDSLKNNGAKKITVQYFTEKDKNEINRAIITYMS